MLLANQIAGFLNQPFLQSKWIKRPNILHVDIWSKMGVANLVSEI